MRINVKNSPELVVPIRATSKSAAYDVVAISDPEIVGEKHPRGGWKRIDYIQYHTGLTTAPQNDPYGNGYHILVHPRSSVSKYNLILANGIGLVDGDYRDEILVRFKYVWQPEDFLVEMGERDSEPTGFLVGLVNMEKIYKKGDRVAQLMSEVTNEQEWVRVEELDKTERTGGFGSTSKLFFNELNDNTVHYALTESKVVPEFIPITNRSVGIQPQEKKVPTKEYESKVDILEKWKQAGGSHGNPTNYETLIREREKNL